MLASDSYETLRLLVSRPGLSRSPHACTSFRISPELDDGRPQDRHGRRRRQLQPGLGHDRVPGRTSRDRRHSPRALSSARRPGHLPALVRRVRPHSRDGVHPRAAALHVQPKRHRVGHRLHQRPARWTIESGPQRVSRLRAHVAAGGVRAGRAELRRHLPRVHERPGHAQRLRRRRRLPSVPRCAGGGRPADVNPVQ